MAKKTKLVEHVVVVVTVTKTVEVEVDLNKEAKGNYEEAEYIALNKAEQIVVDELTAAEFQIGSVEYCEFEE